MAKMVLGSIMVFTLVIEILLQLLFKLAHILIEIM